MVDAGEFAEWAHVHGNMYGTAIKTLEEFRHDGVDVILDIDCQGALKLKERFGCGVYIFILPPDLQELRRRLNQRNSETPETIERRLEAATDEIRESRWYDYIIVNVLFQQAADELKSVLLAEHCRTGRVLKAVSEIFDIQ